MNTPAVSVIIPNYNHAEYLRQRIDSILNQSYQNIEIIILDDCSTDESRDVIDDYRSHPLITHVKLGTVNTGSPFKQWANGISQATGNFIWIAESDDYADSDFLEIMVDTLSRDPRLGLVYCDSHIVVHNQVQAKTFADLKNEKLSTDRWSIDHSNNGISEIEDFVMGHGTINNTSAVLFRRQVIDQTWPFDIDFRFIGDKYAFIKILSVSNVGYVAKPLNYYRASESSKPKHTNSYMDYVYEDFKIFDWIQRNLNVDHDKFRSAFRSNTENSLVSGWDSKKIKIYGDLMKTNRILFLKFLYFNVLRSFKRLL